MPAHNTTTYTAARRVFPFVGNMHTRLTADTSNIPPNMGFIPAVTGFARIMGGTATALEDCPTVAGIYVGMDIKQFDKTNSTAGQELFVIRQGAS